MGVNYVSNDKPVIRILTEVAKLADTLPISDEDKRDLLAFAGSQSAAAAPENAMPDMRFVHYDRREDVYHVQDIRHSGSGSGYHKLNISGDPMRYTEANLPEFIRDKTTVLRIMDTGKLVPGIGARLCDSVWYVVA